MYLLTKKQKSDCLPACRFSFSLLVTLWKFRFSCPIEFAFLAQFFVREKFDAKQRWTAFRGQINTCSISKLVYNYNLYSWSQCWKVRLIWNWLRSNLIWLGRLFWSLAFLMYRSVNSNVLNSSFNLTIYILLDFYFNCSSVKRFQLCI